MKTTLKTMMALMLWAALSSLGTSWAETGALTLEQAIQISIHNNPALGAAKEAVIGAGFAEKMADAGFYPKVSTQYSHTALSQDPYMIGGGMRTQIADTQQHHWDIVLNQAIFTGHALTAQYAMATLTRDIMTRQQLQALLDLVKRVKSAYYRLLLNQKIQEVAEDAVVTLTSHAKDAQLFLDRGIIRLNDLLRAEVALAQAVQSRERAGADVGIARSDLNRWLSWDVSAPTRVAAMDQALVRSFDLDVLIQTGLKDRPFLQAMALTKQILEEAVTLAKSPYYPTVSASGRYGRDGDTPVLDNNDFSNKYNASVSIMAQWTLFDAGKTRSGVLKAESEKRAFDLKIREAEDAVRLEIKSVYLNLGVAEKNIKTARTALSQAEENLRITRLGYQREAATSSEVLDARTDLTQAKTNYYSALYGYMDTLAALERAVGKAPANLPAGRLTESCLEQAHLIHYPGSCRKGMALPNRCPKQSMAP